jgi:DNA-binding NtrC family response regulator
LDFAALSQRRAQVATGTKDAIPSGEWFNEAFTFPPDGFVLEEAIMRLIHHALKQTNQNVSAAARLLGVSRDYLRYRLSGKAAGETTGGEPGAHEPGS